MFTGWAAKKVVRLLLHRFAGRFLDGDLNCDRIDVQLGHASVQLSAVRLNTAYLNSQVSLGRSFVGFSITVVLGIQP